MRFNFLTLFPGIIDGWREQALIKKMSDRDLIEITTTDIREFTEGRQRQVDDKPYGSEFGMLIQCEPVAAAIAAARTEGGERRSRVVLLAPTGRKLTQSVAQELADSGDDLLLLCGRYEGIDQRVISECVDESICVGDAVVQGGEVPAMLLVEAVSRLLPDALGDAQSHAVDSFAPELFGAPEWPQYSKPAVWREQAVPEVLRGGNHAAIADFNFSQIRGLTAMQHALLDFKRTVLPHTTRNLRWRLPQRSDIDAWVKWFNDPEVYRYLAVPAPCSRADEEAFFAAQAGDINGAICVVCDKASGAPIGNIGITAHANAMLEFGIALGDKSYWGRGLGNEVLREVLRLAFTKLGAQTVQFNSFIANAGANKLYERAGMRRVGVLRENFERDGQWWDEQVWQLTKGEWGKFSNN